MNSFYLWLLAVRVFVTRTLCHTVMGLQGGLNCLSCFIPLCFNVKQTQWPFTEWIDSIICRLCGLFFYN